MRVKTIITTAVTMLLLAWGIQSFAGEAKKEGAKKAPYPLKTCVVSGDSLDAMGKPYVYKHKGQEVRFCCKGCIKDFQKEPEKYLAKIKKAQKAQPAVPNEESSSHAETPKTGGHDNHSGHNH